MDNVRDIRKMKNLYFVLSDKISENNTSTNAGTAIMLFLYYEESLNEYLSYIDKIPSFIDVYIVSNNDRLYSHILRFIEESQRKIKFVRSEKRGREISALLVACRDIVLNYEYICFVHDKKRKDYIPEADFNLWIENLWRNTIGSEKYILNVLNVLDTNKKIGLLVPPEPIGNYLSAWYDNVWASDFELANQLVEEMNLKCDLDINKSPVTLGTFFWAKSVALKKLFKKNWKYEDFDEEPLKDDGTISHAIERILGYVAQDAGYDTGTIMNISYAEKLFSIAQEYFSDTYRLLKRTYNIVDHDKFLKKKNLIYNFYKENVQTYLYGAGKIGKQCLQLLRSEGCEPSGFIVTDNSELTYKVEGLSVKTIDEIDNIEDAGIIITVSAQFQKEIETNLRLRGIKNYIKYMD